MDNCYDGFISLSKSVCDLTKLRKEIRLHFIFELPFPIRDLLLHFVFLKSSIAYANRSQIREITGYYRGKKITFSDICFLFDERDRDYYFKDWTLQTEQEEKMDIRKLFTLTKEETALVYDFLEQICPTPPDFVDYIILNKHAKIEPEHEKNRLNQRMYGKNHKRKKYKNIKNMF
jgi:hypothetical protein